MGMNDGVSFEAEEDEALAALVEQHGKKWQRYIVPGFRDATGNKRSLSSLRNRWQRIERGRHILSAEGPMTKRNRCQRCGLFKIGHICRADKEDASETSERTNEDSYTGDVAVDAEERVEERSVEDHPAEWVPAYDIVKLKLRQELDEVEDTKDLRIFTVLHEYRLFPAAEAPITRWDPFWL